MSGSRPWTPRTYTPEEKSRLVTEIDRRFRAGHGTLRVIAAALGTTDTSYHNWVKAGIKPAPPATAESTTKSCNRVYSPTERAQLIGEVERLRAAGHSTVSACRTLGISLESFRRWRLSAAPAPLMRPVEVTALVPVTPTAMALVAPRPAQHMLTLVAPGGYRIEGLSTESAAALLRALA